MKKIITISTILVALALLFVLFQGIKMNRSKSISINNQKIVNVEHLDWQEFKKQAALANTIVIDIRTANEYNAGKLFSDAVIDFDYYKPDFEQKISKLDKDKTYLIYCRSGNRSGKALTIFKKYGLKAYDLKGGHKSTPADSLK